MSNEKTINKGQATGPSFTTEAEQRSVEEEFLKERQEQIALGIVQVEGIYSEARVTMSSPDSRLRANAYGHAKTHYSLGALFETIGALCLQVQNLEELVLNGFGRGLDGSDEMEDLAGESMQ